MAWSYCNCGFGLGEPTPEEVIKQEQECDSCGKINKPYKRMGDLILELIERVEKLEGKVK